jgi:hypothetical protein
MQNAAPPDACRNSRSTVKERGAGERKERATGRRERERERTLPQG